MANEDLGQFPRQISPDALIKLANAFCIAKYDLIVLNAEQRSDTSSKLQLTDLFIRASSKDQKAIKWTLLDAVS